MGTIDRDAELLAARRSGSGRSRYRGQGGQVRHKAFVLDQREDRSGRGR